MLEEKATQILERGNTTSEELAELKEAMEFFQPHFADLVGAAGECSDRFRLNIYRGNKLLASPNVLSPDFLLPLVAMPSVVDSAWDRPGDSSKIELTVQPFLTNPREAHENLDVRAHALLLLVAQLDQRGSEAEKAFRDSRDLTARFFYTDLEARDEYRHRCAKVFFQLASQRGGGERLRYLHLAAQMGHAGALSQLVRLQANGEADVELVIFAHIRALLTLGAAAFQKFNAYTLACQTATTDQIQSTLGPRLGLAEKNIKIYTSGGLVEGSDPVEGVLSVFHRWFSLVSVQKQLCERSQSDTFFEDLMALISGQSFDDSRKRKYRYKVSEQTPQAYLDGKEKDFDTFEASIFWLREVLWTHQGLYFAVGSASQSIKLDESLPLPPPNLEVDEVQKRVSGLMGDLCVSLAQGLKSSSDDKAYRLYCLAFAYGCKEVHSTAIIPMIKADKKKNSRRQDLFLKAQISVLHRDRRSTLEKIQAMCVYFRSSYDNYNRSIESERAEAADLFAKIGTASPESIDLLSQEFNKKKEEIRLHEKDRDMIPLNKKIQESYSQMLLHNDFLQNQEELFQLLTTQGRGSVDLERMYSLLRGWDPDASDHPLKQLRALWTDLEAVIIFGQVKLVLTLPQTQIAFVNKVKKYLHDYLQFVFRRDLQDRDNVSALQVALKFSPDNIGEVCFHLVADRNQVAFLAAIKNPDSLNSITAYLDRQVGVDFEIAHLSTLIEWLTETEAHVWRVHLERFFSLNVDRALRAYQEDSSKVNGDRLVSALKYCPEKMVTVCFLLIRDPADYKLFKRVAELKGCRQAIEYHMQQHEHLSVVAQRAAVSNEFCRLGDRHFKPQGLPSSTAIFDVVGLVSTDLEQLQYLCQPLVAGQSESLVRANLRRLLYAEAKDTLMLGKFPPLKNGAINDHPWMASYTELTQQKNETNTELVKWCKIFGAQSVDELQGILLKSNRAKISEVSGLTSRHGMACLNLEKLFHANSEGIVKHCLDLLAQKMLEPGYQGLLLIAAFRNHALKLWKSDEHQELQMLDHNNVRTTTQPIDLLFHQDGRLSQLIPVENPKEYERQQQVMQGMLVLGPLYAQMQKQAKWILPPSPARPVSVAPPQHSMGRAGNVPADSPPRYQRDARNVLEGEGPRHRAIVPQTLLFPPDEPKKSSGCCCGGKSDDDLNESFLHGDIRLGIN